VDCVELKGKLGDKGNNHFEDWVIVGLGAFR